MKLKFKKPKSQLDEMQELQLKKTESIGFYLVMGGLAVAMVIQGFMGMPPEQMAGELFVFEGGCIYMIINYLRTGIWDRFLKPSLKVHIIGSVVTGICVFVISLGTIAAYAKSMSKEIDSLLVTDLALLSIVTAVTCFVLMLILDKLYKKRRAKLDEE